MRLLSWHERAVEAIEAVHLTLPPGIGFEDRRKAIQAAYPFGEREHHPYKAWLKAQRAYLTRYSDRPAGPLDVKAVESPMERMMRRARDVRKY